ncbi:hypothetical protein HY008_00115 [Candidatus Woesebacteria bacterium]|nr:hypothetical protein [Candidatus Woesebacteria bacterium]
MINQRTSSQLTPDQIVLFYDLWFGLLQYTNEQHKLVAKMVGKNFHQGINTEDAGKEDAGKIAKYIWSHPEVFDEYLESGKLDNRKVGIIRSWQHYHYQHKFYVVKYVKDGAVFLSIGKDEKPYLVKGLVSVFDEMWPKQALPQIVDTVLLPFEGAITTCGLYYGSGIYFGSNMSRDIREACQQAELTYGLITTLPFTKTVNKEDKDIGQIKFYLQSEKNLELYTEELEILIHKNKEKYLPVYFYHRGLLQAKTYKREYRKLGIKTLHFTLYGAVVIAAHTNKQQVEDTVRKLVPAKELGRIVYDRV